VASATGRQERRGNEASAPKRHFAAVFANEPINEENTLQMWFYTQHSTVDLLFRKSLFFVSSI
jgi:hypothetical protein